MTARRPAPTPLLLAALALAIHGGAGAACSRNINVPVSANGASFVVEGNKISGIYPDMLRSLERKTGCHFVLTAVPRARQVAMFESGQSDVLAPATQTAQRDQFGVFVPMIGHRAMLIFASDKHAPVASAQELLQRHELRVAVVRGFDYGEQYTALINELGKQGRLFMEVDVVAVARLLNAGSADLTIMGPTLMAGAIRHDARVRGLQDKLQTQAIPELPWNSSGAYLSYTALKPEDRALLQDALEKTGKSNAVMDGYRHYFQPEVLEGSVRPR